MATSEFACCFPRLYAAASLKPYFGPRRTVCEMRFPRLYAAASLKQPGDISISVGAGGFPRLYAAASLKPPSTRWLRRFPSAVFRGFMPRPH